MASTRPLTGISPRRKVPFSDLRRRRPTLAARAASVHPRLQSVTTLELSRLVPNRSRDGSACPTAAWVTRMCKPYDGFATSVIITEAENFVPGESEENPSRTCKLRRNMYIAGNEFCRMITRAYQPRQTLLLAGNILAYRHPQTPSFIGVLWPSLSKERVGVLQRSIECGVAPRGFLLN